MNILAYNDVDPFEVLQLNLVGRGTVFTPETVAILRRTDPRIFPWLTLNAEQRGRVIGQVGAFRQSMMSTAGPVDVGAVWGFVVRPDIRARGMEAKLLEELHARMRADGLRMSVVFCPPVFPWKRVFYRLGYQDLHSPGSAFARWQTAYQPTRLSACLAGPEGYERVERLFEVIAAGRLGFSRRPSPFPPLRAVTPGHLWIIRQAGEEVGYAVAHTEQSVLKLSQMVLKPDVDAAEAVSALAANLRAAFIHAEVNRPGEVADLQRAGYRVSPRSAGALMFLPLVPDGDPADVPGLFGTGTDRFQFAGMDVLGP